MKKFFRFVIHPICILFIFTALFRLWFAFSHITFTQDFARDLFLTERSQQQGTIFVSYGPKASVGNFYLPPFYYQLLLTLKSLNDWPLFIIAIICVLESITPVLVYYLLANFTKKSTAIIGATLYSLSALAITFGVFPWNPNMIPFFTTLGLLLIIHYIKHQKLWQLVFSLLSVALAFQLHYQAAVIFPFYLFVFVFLILKKQFFLSHWLLAIVIALIPFLPYFYAESINNFGNSREIFAYFSQEHTKYFDRVSKISYPTTFLPSFFERELTKVNFPFIWFGRVIFFLGFPILYFQTKKRGSLPIFAYFLILLISLRFYKGDKLDYYLSTLFIFPTVLITVILDKSKLFGLILVCISIILSGAALGKVSTSNQLQDLEATMLALNEEYSGQSVRLIVHNIDFANTVLYGLDKYTNISIDQNSLIVLDVCNRQTDCLISNPYCTKDESKMDVFSSVLRTSGQYSLLNFTTASSLPFQMYVGKFETEPSNVENPISYSFDRYGTDIINPKIFSE